MLMICVLSDPDSSAAQNAQLNYTNTDNLLLAPNFRIHPSSNAQIEPVIVRHPSNPDIMFASSYTVKLGTMFRSEGVYVTTNGGLNWFGSDSCTGLPDYYHGGDPGAIIDKNGRFILTHQGGWVLGMFSNYSTDLGATWSNNYTIASDDQDKGSPGTDDVPSSAYYGRTYLVWTRYTPPYPIVVSYTTNGAVSWSAIKQINFSVGGHQSLGASVTVGPSGKVYVCWALAIQSYPFTEDNIGFAVSSNGGDNWTVNETAFDCNGIKTYSLPPWGIRVNSYPGIDADESGGVRNGWIYIVTTDKNLPPSGSDPDIIFHRSTDGGLNWSGGIRVNQDALNNGKIQYFPAIRVDEDGGINIIYYDNRDITSDSMQVYLSRSTNGGDTWNDYRISDHRFVPKPIAGAGTGNQGDNIGITSGNGKLWPVWMDDFSGIYQIWTVPIDYHLIGIKRISSEIPALYNLYQNYPNPFNPSTQIAFSVPKREFIKIEVYNLNGQIVKTLISGELDAGKYAIEFEGTNLSSGIYFSRMTASGYSSTKKMILLR